MWRAEVSHSSSVLCSKCVLEHRDCRMETLGLQHEALKATGFPLVEAGPGDGTWQDIWRREEKMQIEAWSCQAGGRAWYSVPGRALSIQKAVYF